MSRYDNASEGAILGRVFTVSRSRPGNALEGTVAPAQVRRQRLSGEGTARAHTKRPWSEHVDKQLEVRVQFHRP